MTDIHRDKVLILDFGSQYTQLIARRIREAGVYNEILPWNADGQTISDVNPRAVILSGGPDSVTGTHERRAPDCVFELGRPVLGICYGMQTMARQLGGQVSAAAQREFGYARIRARGRSRLLQGLQDADNEAGHGLLDVWMSHGDRVEALPPGFKVIATSDNAPIAGMADEARALYGLQFHPEVTHTRQGSVILQRFIGDIAGCAALWTTENIIQDALVGIRDQVGEEQVLLALSGGVDSAVAAALLQRAIGAQLTCIFVDTGLLRLNEAEQVMQTFAGQLGIKVICVAAGARFLERLRGVSDPEAKRKLIGREFIAIFEERAAQLEQIKWLAQGTIYPDLIESAKAGSAQAQLIKSHHNVGGLPERMQLKLIEPLRELFKDEVRKLGVQLGLPDEIIRRHPFPGPGLGVRILGEVKQEYADLLRQVDDVFMRALVESDLYHEVSQAFAVFMPVRSVGVKGDGRHYDYVVALRAVQTVDFMTASWARLPYDFLQSVSDRIMNEVEGVSRVTYDISSKPPATVEWE